MANTTSPDFRQDATRADEHSVLVGFDVSGFSTFVGLAHCTHGAQAGEMAADALARGEAVVTALMRSACFEWVDSTGDGAIYQATSSGDGSQLARSLLRDCERVYLQTTGLKARFAQEAGNVATHHLPFALEEQEVLVWGEGPARLHRELQKLSGKSKNVRLADSAFRSRARSGDVSEHIFLFLRLLHASQWASLDTERLDDVLLRLLEWLQPIGARIDRVTHDEKGVHLRISAPAWTIASGWTSHITTPLQMLSAAGFPDAAASLTTGPVYKGRFEEWRRVIHGVAINRAAKLCSTLESGQISVDHSLDRHVFEARSRKGTAVFVGRSRLLQRATAELCKAGTTLVVLSGEAGIGKSEVARELVARVAPSASVVVECAASGTFQPFGAVKSIVRRAFAAVMPDNSDELAFALEAMAARSIPAGYLGLAEDVLRSNLHDLPALPELEIDERRTATALVLRNLLAHIIARFNPLVVIDDLHWADQGSLALLHTQLGMPEPARIIATQRPAPANTRLNALLALPACHMETLRPLTVDEIADLISSAPDLRMLPIGARQLHAISGGSPFHAIQAALLLSDGQPASTNTGVLDLTLDARLDNLGSNDLDALRVLALHERSLPWEEVQAVLERISPDALAPRAEVRVRLIRRWYARPAEEEGKLMLEHRLLRDAVLRRMPVGVRQTLASASARRLRSLMKPGGESVEDWAEVARLWAEGGSFGRAAALYERAARAAMELGAYASASSLFECALRSAPKARRGVQWHASRGAAQWSIGLTEQANDSSRTAIKLARNLRLNPRLKASALTAAAVRAETGQFLGRLPDLLGGAMDVFRYASNRGDIAIARGRVVGSLAYLCGLARAKRLAGILYRMGERIGREEGNFLPSSYILLSRAILSFINGAWDEAAIDLSRVRGHLESMREPQLLEVLETLCGLGAHLQGEHERALERFRVLAALADSRGHAMHSAWARYASAQSLLALGRCDAAWEQLLESEALLGNVSDRQSDLICLGLRARLALGRGDLAEALRAAEVSGALGRTIPPTNFSSTEGYAAAAWVGAIVQRVGTDHSQRVAAAQACARYRTVLDRYALMFPIARPRRLLVRAISLPAGKEKARALIAHRAASLAESMGMKGEAELSRRVASWLGNSSLTSQEMY